MAYNYPPIPPEDLTAEQRDAHSYLDVVTEKMFGPSGEVFIYKDENGGYLGPMALLLRTPALCNAVFQAASAVGTIGALEPRLRELVILATGAVYQAEYSLYGHSLLSEKQNIGFSHQQVVDARDGRTPGGLSKQEATAYEVALKLARTPGPLDKASLERARTDLGELGALSLANFVGFYAWMCLLMNFANLKAEGPF